MTHVFMKRVAILSALVTNTASSEICTQPTLRPVSGYMGYQKRGERWEGLFVQEVAGAGEMRIVSYGSDLAEGVIGSQPLELSWKMPALAAACGNLRAVSRRSGHYYQMDAGLVPKSSFQWPTELLRSETMRGGEIGLTAWLKSQDSKTIYLPVSVNGGDNFRLLIEPGVELSEVYFTVSRELPGRSREFLTRDKSLKRTYVIG